MPFFKDNQLKYEPLGAQYTSDLERPTVVVITKRRSCTVLITVANIILFLLTVFISFFSHSDINACLKRTSSYSPIYDHPTIDLSPSVQRINGTLFGLRDDPSIARQMPNIVADEMWTELETTRIFPISREDVIKLGKDPKTAVKIEDDVWGEGEEKYASVLDMFHQLHCLNSLRQMIYGGYYNQTAGDHNKPKRHHELHINHCMDIMYQTITCSNNMNLITLHWAEGQPGPFPDMSINRQCIDFPELVEWRKKNTLDMDTWIREGVMDKPKGHAEMPWGIDIP